MASSITAPKRKRALGAARQTAETALQPPVDVPVSSPFGRREDPIKNPTGGTDPKNPPAEFHNGIDYKVPAGTPVGSAGDGQVWHVANQEGYGNVVIVEHTGAGGTSFYTLYAHLKSVAVKPGQSVLAGDIIGRSGSSGRRSTGAHLHFEIIEPGHRLQAPRGPDASRHTGIDPKTPRADPQQKLGKPKPKVPDLRGDWASCGAPEKPAFRASQKGNQLQIDYLQPQVQRCWDYGLPVPDGTELMELPYTEFLKGTIEGNMFIGTLAIGECTLNRYTDNGYVRSKPAIRRIPIQMKIAPDGQSMIGTADDYNIRIQRPGPVDRTI